jgi:AbrB family looped-hinge helix DNA binding protein
LTEITSTITSKGQVTILVEIRRRLRLKRGDKVAFVITETGSVELRASEVSFDCVAGWRAGTLRDALEIEDAIEIEREDALEEGYRNER